MNLDTLSKQLCLYFLHVHIGRAGALLEGDSGCNSSTLSGDGASHHVPHGCVGSLVTCDTSATNQQVVNTLGQEASIGNLEVATTRRQDQNVVSINEFRECSDGVRKAGLIADILRG